MVDLKHADVRIIDEAFQADPGYALNFSDRTFAEYFDDEFGVDIDQPEYRAGGSSKMNRLRTFFRVSDAALVGRVMRNLADYRESIFGAYDSNIKERLFGLITRVEGGSEIAARMRSSVARSCGAGRLPRKMWRSMSNWSSSTQEG